MQSNRHAHGLLDHFKAFYEMTNLVFQAEFPVCVCELGSQGFRPAILCDLAM